MDAMPQVPFAQNNYLINPERRCPSGLVVDTSGSMAGRMAELNAAIAAYISDLKADPLARKRVETAVTICGGTVNVAHHIPPPISSRFLSFKLTVPHPWVKQFSNPSN